MDLALANNITTAQGAISISAGPRFRILGNNIENSAAGAAANNNAALIDINGSNGVLYGGVIAENLVSGFGATDATRIIRLGNCRGTMVQNNVLLSGAAGLTQGIVIDANCQDVRIGPNAFDAGVSTQVVDNGVGTMGVVKQPALANGWLALAAGTYGLAVIKSIDGIVHVTGAIKSGTMTNGTIVGTLPTNFAPGQIIRVPIMHINAGVPTLAEMAIDTSGNLIINYVTSNTQVEFNFSFPAANLANSASLE